MSQNKTMSNIVELSQDELNDVNGGGGVSVSQTNNSNSQQSGSGYSINKKISSSIVKFW
jgi:hypothetical protein